MDPELLRLVPLGQRIVSVARLLATEHVRQELSEIEVDRLARALVAEAAEIDALRDQGFNSSRTSTAREAA